MWIVRDEIPNVDGNYKVKIVNTDDNSNRIMNANWNGRDRGFTLNNEFLKNVEFLKFWYKV